MPVQARRPDFHFLHLIFICKSNAPRAARAQRRPREESEDLLVISDGEDGPEPRPKKKRATGPRDRFMTTREWIEAHPTREYTNHVSARIGTMLFNAQRLVEAWIDCDGDTLLLKVDQLGPACHTGAPSCFFRKLTG